MSNPLSSYRADMHAAQEALASIGMTGMTTSFGTVRYADRGEGPVVLAVHGITEGTPGGLKLARAWVPEGFRVIAPSRFGYLGSELPPRATPAMQADAFAALLDALDIERAFVLAASAGTTSALSFALRHRDRTGGQVLVSSNVPGPHQGGGPPRFVLQLLFAHDPLLWAFRTYLAGAMAGLIGQPKGLPMTPEDQATLAEAMNGVFPARPKVRGVLFDAYESNPAVQDIPLEQIAVPTLVVHARDDAGPPYERAVAMARRIPDARLLTIERGGHLMMGDHSWAIREVGDFLRTHASAPALVEGRRV